MRKRIVITIATLAITLGAGSAAATASDTVSASNGHTVSAKTWPRWAERSFINNCHPRNWRPLSCTEVLRAIESRYSVRQFIHLNNRQIHRLVNSLY